jgi:hypothetical protein
VRNTKIYLDTYEFKRIENILYFWTEGRQTSKNLSNYVFSHNIGEDHHNKNKMKKSL